MPPSDDRNDPILGLIVETTQALVSMSASMDAHTKAINEAMAASDTRNRVLDEVASFMKQHAEALEEKNRLEDQAQAQAREDRQSRWKDVKNALTVLYSNTILSGALTLALAMVVMGAALWILTQLGVDIAQVAPWLPGIDPTPSLPTEVP